MAISDLLTKLTEDIRDSYDAVEAKGGTIPEHKNTDNLPDAIESIQGGGGDFTCKTPYGRLWYAPFEDSWVIEYSSDCSVTIDQAKFSAYEATNPLEDRGMGKRANFDYNSEEGTWQSWSFETPIDNITTAQMAEQLGLTITLEPGAEWAGFEILLGATPLVGEWEHLDLDSTDWTNIGNDPHSAIVIGDKTIPREFVRRFEFGTIPTTIPGNFLSFSGLEELGEITSNYESVGANLGQDTNLNSPLIVQGPAELHMDIIINSFNNAVVFNPPASQTQTIFYWRSNASILAFGKNVKRIELTSMPGFNGTLVFPEGLERLLMGWLGELNTSFILPQTLTRLECCYALNSFTGTINVGNLSPSICAPGVGGLTLDHFLSANSNTAPAFITGIKIAGPNRAAWLSAFPAKAISSGNKAYRHLVDAGY